MVTKRKQHSSPRPVKQGRGARAPRPNRIGASTPYNFRGKNLTPYGGLLPVATLLEKLGFHSMNIKCRDVHAVEGTDFQSEELKKKRRRVVDLLDGSDATYQRKLAVYPELCTAGCT